jgi:hypothetical protein
MRHGSSVEIFDMVGCDFNGNVRVVGVYLNTNDSNTIGNDYSNTILSI